jgi:hypothetical protein
LYRDGGFSEVKRGIFDRIVTSGPSKRARRKITKILGGDLIWDREWDVLLVLDACRADVFREHVGEVETIDSIGSTSQTWISRTFGKDDLNDVGYVTGNPFSTEIETDRLGYFHVQSAELTDYGIETVPPIVLAEHAIDVWRRRDKIGIDRLIVHFMQPHTPFRSRSEWFQNAVGDGGWSGNFWRQFRGGEFKHDDVWAAYEDNLQWVIEEGVEPIQKNCEGLIH